MNFKKRPTIFVSLLISFLFGCETKSELANKNFVERYGSEVSDINSRRIEQKVVADQLAGQNKRSWKSTQEIFDIDSVDFFRSAHIDTSLIQLPPPPQESLPNMETLMRGRMAGLPDDMFMIKYNEHNFPDSYGRPRLSFDDIEIPTRDAFGVATELGDKNYQLINGKSLQQDIDFARSQRESYDNEVSLKLIRQEKERKRKEYLAKKLQEKELAEAQDKEENQNEADQNEEINDESQTENTNQKTN